MSGRIFLVAGEPWGDAIGARLIQALRHQTSGELAFDGVGGPRMASCGLQSLFPINDLALGSRAEMLPRLPRLWRRLAQAAREVDRRGTDLVLTIASPGVAMRLQRRLTARPLVRVHYGAPQTWAWREERAARLARDLDHLLTLLPFEPALFRRHGVPCSFVGHPIVEEVPIAADGARFRRRYELPADAPLLCLLPGTQENEVKPHLLVLAQAVALIWRQISQLRLVLPTTPRMAPLVKRVVARWKLPVLVLEDRAERFDAYDASWLAIAAAGTVSLELALAGLPGITIYRTGPLTAWLARRLIRAPHVNPVNLILGRPAVPELLQEDCRADRIAAAATRLIGDEARRQEQQAALAEAVARLRAGDERPPSARAAAQILELLADGRNVRRTA
ncbi:MAG TPA: lipid-A-disaccharide synthase [Geminicoccaceae bacterium]|nr:lipid-A-disaccharide synthase [Geminicoccaceae bacterium]